ncbi:hypothetical protein P8452_66245 [Trifolium repens]|nr:hypothetical protein P8452_66245 [Trifolium repens]
MARSSDDEPVLLMAYESDDDEPVKLTFSDSEEVSEDDYEIGVRLYDSESESEVSEDESESEDDSEDEEVSEPESSEDESEDEGDSEEPDSEGSDSEGSDSEGDSEGSEDEESQCSEGGRTSDNISDARASEGETYGSPTSEEEEDLEGKSDSESDGGDDSDGASDSDPESSGDSDGGDQDSEDVGSGGQASEFDHDFEGGPSEGGASKGSPASNNGHVSKGETSEGRVSGSIQDSGDQDSEGGASGVGCPASYTVPELEEDCDSGIDYGASSGVQGSEGASSEVRSSEFVTTEEILEKQVWLQAMTEELETLSNFGGLSSLTPLLGAFIADSFAGRFWTIVVATLIYGLGLITITTSAIVPHFHPPPCPTQMQCQEPKSTHLWILYLALFLTSLGSGGIRSCVVPFSGDQFDMTKKGVESRKWNLFNWYFFCTGLASLSALTIVVYIQDHMGWGWGLGIPTIAMFISLIAFVLGSRLYKTVKPNGSPFVRLAQVIVAALKKRNEILPQDPKLLYQNVELDSPISLEGRLSHSDQFKHVYT